MKNIKLFIMSICLCASTYAVAEKNAEKKWSLGGGFGQAFPTGPSTFFNNEEKKNHGSLWLRHNLDDKFSAEANIQRLNFGGRQGSTDADLTGFTFNAVWNAPATDKWNVVCALGAGLGEINNYGTKKYTEFYALIRHGGEYKLNESLNIGAHLQFNYSPQNSGKAPSELHSLSYLLALNYAFGSGKNRSTPAVVESQVPEKSTAQDHDTDGDGILDSSDKCPKTKLNAKVNAYGCEETEKAQISLNLVFAPGKVDLAESQKSQIKNLADFMKQYPSTQVTIEGHTDISGNENNNLKLSQARAEAVKVSLIQDFGIDAKRLVAQGFGSSKPIGSNETAAGKTKNRRVVATINEK